MKNSLRELKEKITEKERKSVENLIKETPSCLISHPDEPLEEYTKRQKALEELSDSIITKTYQNSGGSYEINNQPQVDELD